MAAADPFVVDVDVTQLVSADHDLLLAQRNSSQRLSLMGEDHVRNERFAPFHRVRIRFLSWHVLDTQRHAFGVGYGHHGRAIDHSGPTARGRVHAVTYLPRRKILGVPAATADQLLVDVVGGFVPCERSQEKFTRHSF